MTTALGIRATGAPDLPSGYHGSVSHTEGFVGAVAAQGGSIGIDVENRWHSFFGAASHRFGLEHPSGDRDLLLRYWVSIEAVAKASGVPLSEVVGASLANGQIKLRETWLVRTTTIGDGVMLGLATSDPIPKPALVWLSRRSIP